MSANYRNPNFLLPNEVNMATNPDLSVDRHSLYSTEFSGTSYVTIGSTISGTGAATISMWLNTDTISDDNRILSNTDNYNFSVKFDGTGSIQVYGPTEGWSTVVSGLSVDNQWFHLCIVFDGAGNVTGYKNGILGSTQTTTANRSNLGLAAKINLSYGSNYNGTMDEVALFNTALTQSQVQALADSKDSPINPMALPTKPIAYYPLGEQARNTGYLSSGSDVSGSEWQFPNQSIQSTAVNFSSNPSLITVPDSSALRFVGTDFSISFWLQPTAGGNQIIMDKYGPGGWGVYLQSGNLRFLGSGPNYWQTMTTVSQNVWTHILIVGDNTGQNLICYKNGTEVYNAAYALSINSTTVDLIIGTENNSSTLDYVGYLSNIAMWNSNESSEKDNIYNNGTPASSYTNTPTAWWKLNAANSSYDTSTSTWTFTDSAGSNNGTSTTLPTSALVRSDLQFESPYSNFSLDFDGITSTINVPDSSLLKPSKITVSMWIKGGTQSTYTYCLAKYYTGSGVAYGFTTGSSTTKIAFTMRKGDDSGWVTTGFSTVMDDNWHNVIGTFDGTNVKLYVDGALTSTVASGTTGITYGSGDLTIGAFLNTGTLDFNGKIDETAIWDTALTAAQVNQIYNNGLAADLTSLSPVSWWRLGEDAYFVNNNITIPNQIAGGPSGTGSGTQTSMLVADAPGSYGSGSGVNLDIVDRIGEAPGTSPVNIANSQSYNMTPSSRISAPKPFIMEIITTGTNESFRLYSAGNTGTPYKILWGDGSSEINSNNDVTHTYSLAGTYEITIPEPYNKSSFSTIGSNRSKISKIKQWGTLNWINLLSSWQYLPNFSITATDKANFSNVTSFSGAFRNSSMTNLGLYKDWVSSNCNNLGLMFYQTSLIGDFDFSSWDTSNVTNLTYFIGNSANITSIDTTSWDIGKVTNFFQFAVNCTNLTKIIGHENWDVSKVTSFDSFLSNSRNIEEFNPSSWDVSSVQSFGSAFQYAFQGLINPIIDLGSWDTSSVTSFYIAFRGNNTITSLGSINNWDVSNVTNMGYMFNSCSSLNLPNLSSWDTSSVTSLTNIFSSTTGASGSGIENWNTSSVTNAGSCFSFSVDVFNFTSLNWDLRNCSNMDQMFKSCRFSNSNLTLNIQTDSTLTNCSQFIRTSSGIDTLVLGNNVDFSGVTNFFYAFQGLGNLSLTVPSTLSFASATNFSNFLVGTTLSSADYNALLVRIEATNQINNINFMGGNNVATGAGLTARTALINDHSWTISDGT